MMPAPAAVVARPAATVVAAPGAIPAATVVAAPGAIPAVRKRLMASNYRRESNQQY